MLRIILSVIFFSFFFNCEKDSNPLTSIGDEERTVMILGRSDNNHFNVKISNNFERSVWYSGQEGLPIYSTQIYSKSSWQYSGPGWCGFGVRRIEFKPGESFSINVRKPNTIGIWRVGLLIFQNPEDDGQYYWSQKRK